MRSAAVSRFFRFRSDFRNKIVLIFFPAYRNKHVQQRLCQRKHAVIWLQGKEKLYISVFFKFNQVTSSLAKRGFKSERCLCFNEQTLNSNFREPSLITHLTGSK